ncbi:Hypothetical predicted protein [Paramuricea clavata]|uniref:Uncharacterized protein n=1 Tax=Paramuricea clavata TaxID=317549 RepID=A0A7D9HDY8_PARCT|nr:Hypothetical predicted protein [Paramuricea clavata]
MVDQLLPILFAVMEEADFEEKYDDNNMESFFATAIAMVREDRTKVGNYADLTIPSYLIDDFQRFFRISRGTFEVILRNIAVYLTPDIGRAAITPEKHLLITIWFISHQDTIHRMSDRFSVTDSSIIRCRDRVFTVVLRYLKTKFIYLPKDYNVKVQIMDEYRIGSQFPNVLGAIDGTHIRIVAPSEHSQVYVNRKKFHLLVLQGIRASNMQFLHVLASFHNICIINDDVLEQYIRENQEEAHRHNNLANEDDENGMEKRDCIADGFI